MEGFKAAARKVWYRNDGLVAGYVTHSTNLTRVILSDAGHMSPGLILSKKAADDQRCTGSGIDNDGEFYRGTSV